MPDAAVSRDTQPLEMIEAMTRCAYELGLAASEIAQRARGDTAGFLAASAEFRHCFFAVRMGIRLTLAQRAAARAERAAAPVERPEALEPEYERGDGRDDERIDTEREREGDYEPVSLPQFLKSLRGVAASAERRADLPPHIRATTLPILQGLLGQTSAPPDGERPASAVAVLARPPTLAAARSRLLTSTGPISLPPLRRTAPRRCDSG
jgi:hypothetical protein